MIGSVDKYPKPGGNVRRIDVEKVVVHHKWIEDKEKELELEEELELNERQLNELKLSESDVDEGLLTQFEENKIKYRYHFLKKSYHDIALLKLKERIVPVINETHYLINSICLPKTGIVNKRNENVIVLKIGKTYDKETNPKKLRKELSVINMEYLYPNDWEKEPTLIVSQDFINHSSIFIVNSTGCYGDSGSPSHQYYGWRAVQIGINSAMVGDPIKNSKEQCHNMAVNIRVSFFVQWIRSEISKNDNRIEFHYKCMIYVINVILIGNILFGFFDQMRNSNKKNR